MERTKINELKEKVGKKVLVEGFIHEIRDQSKVKFILIRDNSGIIQTVTTSDKKEIFETIAKIPKESVISIEGIVKAEKQAPSGIEIQVEKYEILSKADPDLPISVVEKGESPALPIRLDYRWIDLRKPKNILIFKIWTFMEKAMREWWDKNDFIQIYSPKLMGTASESGAELFSLEYFGKKAYLAQSPQFYKQMAMAAGFEKIFEIGPVFRANKSHTVRHDTEFTMIDMEISYIKSDEDIRKVEEAWINYFMSRIKEKFGEEIKSVFGVEMVVPSIPFPRITMEEVQKILRKKGYKGPKDDLDAEGEKMICEIIKEKFNHDFIFVTEYPISARPFYHMREKGVTKSFDLIWRGTEVTTGAQREHRPEILIAQAKEKKLSPESSGMKDYLNFFKYGCPPHGGFAISPTRFLMLMLGIKNVREVTFLPRDTERLNP
jgi:aspartyl-tRNA synthetase